MYDSIESLRTATKDLHVILTNGFEQRVKRGAELLLQETVRCSSVTHLVYDGDEHAATFDAVRTCAMQLVEDPSHYSEVAAFEIAQVQSQIGRLDPDRSALVLDITGMSRLLMFELLTFSARHGLAICVIYTEAGEYYPLKRDFSALLDLDADEAFAQLPNYEEAELVYSSSCSVVEVNSLPGRLFPNHPVLLIGFLTFKRARLSCVLNSFETNRRILIRTVPDRDDLRWRERALNVINFDLVEQHRDDIHDLPSLGWNSTYDFLCSKLEEDDARYRYNVLLAPLGGKMQTIGSWMFAFEHSDVKVVSSTPRNLFPEKYSIGSGPTHVVRLPVNSGGI